MRSFENTPLPQSSKTVVSPVSIRYPLQAPPASSHEGDLPRTVTRILTVATIAGGPSRRRRDPASAGRPAWLVRRCGLVPRRARELRRDRATAAPAGEV